MGFVICCYRERGPFFWAGEGLGLFQGPGGGEGGGRARKGDSPGIERYRW